jgi:hypothetical protein
MLKLHFKFSKNALYNTGSTLGVVMILIAVTSGLIAVSMLRTQAASRLINRSVISSDLRAAAEGELERCYLKWRMIQTNQDPYATEVISGLVTSNLTSESIDKDAVKAALEQIPDSYNPDFKDIVFRNYIFKPYSEEDGLITGSNSGTSTRGIVQVSKMIVQVTKKSVSGEISFSLGRNFIVAKSSAFKNAVFYNGTIEMCPGSNMTVNGDIFSNSDIYLGSKGTGNLLKAGGSVSGLGMLNWDFNFRNNLGYNALKKLDYNAPYFPDRASQAARVSQAKSFLGGVNIQSIKEQYRAIDPLNIPNDNSIYHSIIDPAPASGPDPMSKYRIASKASLVATVGKDTSGNPTIKVTDKTGLIDYSAANPLFSQAFVSTSNPMRKAITDKREGTVYVTTLDVQKLNSAIAATPALSNSLDGTWNGIIYMKDTTDSGKPAFRLINGATVPQYKIADKEIGFIAATNAGMYVQGNYNTENDPITNKINRCAVVADAITGLSGNWDDANSDKSKFLRNATDTTYNTAIVTGDVEQTVTSTTIDSSGGPHNLMRLLENWDGRNFTIKGSLIQLFNCKTFNSKWIDQGIVYKTPTNRTIDFDTALDKQPLDGFALTTTAQRGEYFIPTASELIP